jgi:hypothetical protein
MSLLHIRVTLPTLHSIVHQTIMEIRRGSMHDEQVLAPSENENENEIGTGVPLEGLPVEWSGDVLVHSRCGITPKLAWQITAVTFSALFLVAFLSHNIHDQARQGLMIPRDPCRSLDVCLVAIRRDSKDVAVKCVEAYMKTHVDTSAATKTCGDRRLRISADVGDTQSGGRCRKAIWYSRLLTTLHFLGEATFVPVCILASIVCWIVCYNCARRIFG